MLDAFNNYKSATDKKAAQCKIQDMMTQYGLSFSVVSKVKEYTAAVKLLCLAKIQNE